MAHAVEAAMSLLAQERWGTFGDRDAKAHGASRSYIKRKVDDGLWVRFAEGSLGYPDWPPSFERSTWASLHCACVGAQVGPWAAAAIYGIAGFPRTRLQVLVPHGSRHTNAIATVHQTRNMPPMVRFNGFPMASRERVLCEVASQVDARRLGLAVDDQLAKRTITLPRVERVFRSLAVPGWPGLKVMGAVLAERGDSYVPARSDLEREMRVIVGTIPDIAPIYEKQIGDPVEMPHQVDCVIEAPRKLIVETDGRAYHQRMKDMAIDRRRDRRAVRLGYPTFRYLYSEIVNDREGVRKEIMEFLFG